MEQSPLRAYSVILAILGFKIKPGISQIGWEGSGDWDGSGSPFPLGYIETNFSKKDGTFTKLWEKLWPIFNLVRNLLYIYTTLWLGILYLSWLSMRAILACHPHYKKNISRLKQATSRHIDYYQVKLPQNWTISQNHRLTANRTTIFFSNSALNFYSVNWLTVPSSAVIPVLSRKNFNSLR